MQSESNQTGYITLMTVIIMVTVGTVIGSSLILLGIGATQTSQAVSDANEAAALADACAEDALQRLRLDNATTGTSNLTLGNGTCTYTITNSGGSNRDIEATGTVNDVIRKVAVNIDQLSPIINISSWQEVADF